MVNSRVRLLGFLTVTIGLGLHACNGTTQPNPNPNPLPVVSPGDTLPLDTTVRVAQSGTYQLPAGATSLTTRCTGMVTVQFTPPAGPSQSNTCNSTSGSSSQTNIVTGVTSVDYILAAGASADVTVR